MPTANLVGAQHLAGGPYRIPHVLIDSWQVYTNSVAGGHYRAPGEPQSIFAAESHMDSLARAIGMDPLDFRLTNIIGEGNRRRRATILRILRARERRWRRLLRRRITTLPSRSTSVAAWGWRIMARRVVRRQPL